MLAMDHFLPVKMLLDLAAAAIPVLEVSACAFTQERYNLQLSFSHRAHAKTCGAHHLPTLINLFSVKVE